MPAKAFGGGDEANPFLIKRRFPIALKEENASNHFFTKENLQFLKEVADKPYDAHNSIDNNAGIYIRNFLWSKTYAWANLIANELPFDIRGKAQWNDRDISGQKFKHYTWYRLHSQEYNHDKIFYTVGAGSDKALVIKLDCQRGGSNPLSKSHEKLFDSYLKERRIEWLVFDIKQIESMDWNQLLAASIQYIERTFETYKEILAIISNTAEEKCARLCWNSNGWKYPSGRDGKSKTSKKIQAYIHERDNGFAPEEWLFDFDRQIDGYCYGRIEPFHTQLDKHSGNIYNLTLFTHHF